MNDVTLPFQHPFMLTICGPSQSGKTFWIFQILENIEKTITPSIQKIVYLYSSYQPLYSKMEKLFDTQPQSIVFMDCNKGIPPISDIQPNINDNTLVILDDLMMIATSSKENLEKLNHFACRDVHHKNMSVIFTCQNLMYGNGKLRNSRVNSQYLLMFKNISDHRNMHTICSNRKINKKRFDKILDDISTVPYGYLLFDNCATSYNNTRIRTNIFPHEKTIIYDV